MNVAKPSVLSDSLTNVFSSESLQTPAIGASAALTNPLLQASWQGSSSAIAFIDANVTDYQALTAGIASGTEVHLLDSSQDAVTQITNTLLGRHNISSLHIVSHGEDGGLDFGTGKLNLSDLPAYAAQLQSWSKALTDDADILLYGCDVAQGELGRAFTSILSQLTGADVAASDDLTGSAALGGNWTLEYQTGSIEAGLAFSQSARESYTYILPSFTAASPVAIGANPYSVAIGDFNGDGKADFATANQSSNNVSIRLGNGLGGFSGTTTVAVGADPYAVAIGDFNGDGKADFATANLNSNNVSIRLGNGLGGFSGTTTVAVGANPYAVAIGDFNSDGKADFATANYGDGTVSVRLGNGLGGFSGTTTVAVGANPYSVAIGDFNSDGKADFATANYGDGTVSVRLGNGLGGFSGTTTVAVGSALTPISVAIGDFNGDGKADFATANFFSSNTVSVRLGNGLGGFSGTTNVTVGSVPISVAIGDFNGDGKADFATANLNDNTVSVRLGDGLGGFSGTTTVAVGFSPYSVAIGDFNGDGKADFATADSSSINVSVLLNTSPKITVAAGTAPAEIGTTGTFTLTLDQPAPVGGLTVNFTPSGTATRPADYSFSTGSNITSVSANSFVIAAGATTATLNVVPVNDGIVDPNETVILTLATGNDYFLGSNATAQFAAASPVAVGTTPRSVAIGDFNGDGKADFAAANSGSNTVSVRLGDGLGGFSGTTTVAVGSSPYAVAIGDFNGDGKADFATANSGSNTVSVRLGDGLGGFNGTTNVTVGTNPYAVAIGDFNGDGKADFAAADTNSNNTVSVRLGDGLGGFSGTTTVTVGSNPVSVAIGDFNGDGKADFATANIASVNVSVRLGDGLGGFSGTTNVAVGAYPYSVAIGDFNGDGKADFATANSNSNTVSVRLGDGLGGFSGTTTVAVGTNPRSVAIGDFNGDGKADFATANFGDGTVSVRLGDGLGGFSGTTNVAIGANPYSVAIGDFNGDGKADFATATSSPDTVSVLLNANPPPSATLVIADVNTAPVLNATPNPALTAINEDAGVPTGVVGTLVSALVDLNPPVGGFDNVTDGDAGAVTGIAITAADTTNGTWFYSTNNGTNWTALGTVSNTTARLLAADASTRLYFQPTANYNGTVTNALTFRAWDTTSGTNGNTADTSTNGGTTAFSTVTDTAALTVNAVNDAPTVTAPAAIAVTEDTSITLTGISFADVDAGSGPMSAVLTVGAGTLTATTGSGVTVLGSSSSSITLNGTTTALNSFLTNSLTYTPALNATAAQTLGVRINDNGNTGTGGALSSGVTNVALSIAAVNDAPILSVLSNSLNLDGINDYARTTAPITHNQNFTYEAWVKFPTTNPGWSGIVTTSTLAGSGGFVQFSNNGSGRLRAEISGSSTFNVDGTLSISDGNWHHVALTYDGASLKTYVDGTLDINSSVNQTFTVNRQVFIGAERQLSAGWTSAGQITEVRIWNATRTQAEIQANRNQAIAPNSTGLIGYWQLNQNSGTTANDLSSSGLNATLLNGATWATNSPFPGSIPLAAINEDAGAPTGAVGTLVSALVDLNPPVGGFNNVTDADTGAVTGIAITAADTTNGTWFYSTDNGTNWLALGAVANTTARLLAADANTRVYFQPTANYNGTVTNALTFRAWDTTSGTNGNTADTSTNGGITAFSIVTNTAVLTVNAVNDAPTVTAPAAIAVTEDTPTLLTGISFADVDAGSGLMSAVLTVGAGTLAATTGNGVTVLGSASSSITLNGTTTALNSFLTNSLTYTPALNATAAQTLGVSINDNGNTGSGGALSSGVTNVALNIAAVNDAPTVTAPAAIAITEDTTTTLTGISFADVDAGSGPMSAVLTVGAGTLAATAGNGVTVLGSASSSITLNGTTTALNSFLTNSLTYTPALNATAAQTLGVSINDNSNTGSGGALSSGVTNVALNIAAVNDAPTVTAPAAIAITEDTTTTLTGISFADVDAGSGLMSAVLTVGAGTLAATAGSGVTVLGSASSSITLNGTTTALNSFLTNSLTYTPALNATAAQTLGVSINDNSNTGSGGALSSGVTNVALNIAAVNDAPTVTVSAVPLSYTENAAATLIDAGATVGDVDSANFNTGILTVSYTAGSTADDRLTILNQGTGTGQISLDGRMVNFGGATIGTYTGGIGTTPLVITFNSTSATPLAAQALLRAIAFSNVSQTPGTTARSLQVTLSDGTAASTPATRTINVTAVNDAPIVGNTTVLYNGAAGTLPSAQGWTYIGPGVTPTASGGATNLDTTAVANFLAGFGNSAVTLDRTAGYVVSFSAQVVSEARTATADKDLDGKDDRAGFSIIVVSSDTTKAIELGFLSDRVFAQEDGTNQVDPSLQPDATAPNATRTLFTQAESAAFTTTAFSNYDLAIKDDTYTLFVNNTVILSGRLRDYTGFSGFPDPYQVPNQIFFGDDTTSAAANINLSRVAVTTNPVTLPSQTVNEDSAIVLSNLFLGDLDAGANTVTLTLAVANGNITVNNVSGSTLSSNGTATVTVTGTLNQINAILTNATGITYQGNSHYNGADTLTLSLNDNGASGGSPITTTKTLPIVITEVNDAPIATNDALSTVAEDSGVRSITIASLLANDSRGTANESTQTLTITALSNVVGGTAVINGSNIDFTPTLNYNGAASFDYTVQDNGTTNGAADPKTATGTASFSITEVNDAPIAVNDALSAIAENSGVRTISVASLLANDSTGTANESTQTLTITAVSNVVGGTAVINGSNIEFTPTLNYNGPASFDYTVQDNGTTNGAADPKTATGTASFSITEVNDAPIAVNDALSAIAEDSGVRTISVASLLANDSTGTANESSQSLTITALSNVVGGTAVINGSNIEFTPTLNYNGPASFDYTVQDNGTTNGAPDFKTATAKASFTITEVNNAPVASNDALSAVAENSGVRTISVASLLANDSTGTANESSQSLTITALSNVVGGTAVINGSNIEFTPTLNYNGPASFDYTVQDNGTTNGAPDFKTATAKASFTITEVNNAPVASNDALSAVAEDSGVRTISVASLLANDSTGTANESTQTLTITAVSNVVGGTAVINGSNIDFTPTLNYNGAASFDYTVQDNGTTNGAPDFKTATAKASFTITEVNNAPVASNDALSAVAEDSGVRTISVASLLANDSTGTANESTQTLTITAVSNVVGGTAVINGSNIEFTPTLNYNGPASFDYTVQDNGTTNGANDFKTATATASFTITTVNDAPTLTGNVTLAAIPQNTTNPSGSTLNSLFNSLFSDVDAGASLSGLAIVGNTANATTQGRWQYSLDGTTWANIGTVADDVTALALSTSTLVRFVPAPAYNGTPPGLAVRALDNSYTSGFTTGTTRVTVNTTTTGGTTALAGGMPAALNTSVTQHLPNLLWRNNSSGQDVMWQLNNFALQSSYFLPTVSDRNWQIANSQFDFNQDGVADVLWHNQLTGANVIWQMNSTGYETTYTLPTVADLNWRIVGTADFNTDNTPDILWRNVKTGENLCWQMNGFAFQSLTFLTTVADTNWRVAGTADFNGDSKPDILWRNTKTGENVLWQMNGFTLQSLTFLTTVTDLNWQIVTTADFNRDGKADIVWRNKSTGENALWQMNGASLQSLTVLPQVTDLNWQLAGVADLGGDSTPDFLWHHQQSGKEVIWQLNGFSYSQTYQLPDVGDNQWSVTPFVTTSILGAG